MEKRNIVNLNEVEFEDCSFGKNYQIKSSPLAKLMGSQKLGFHVEILAPKKFSCPYHFHHMDEELFLVLEGIAMLRHNNQYREVHEGDLILFTAGSENAHQFYNHTNQDFKFFALSSRDLLEVCEYPDSNKIAVMGKTLPIKIFQGDETVSYLTGEEDPRQYWDPAYLKQKENS